MSILKIKQNLANRFAEREEVVEGLLTAMIARQHVLLIGPPGTAKSALVSELAKMISGTQYFQWLLTRFSTPEELFGPVSLKELEQGIYKRNTAGKLPEAHLTFLDEIFKANSAILNSLLTLINERLFYNNGLPVKTPLMSVIGASNEWPEEGEGLEALFDRFLLRYELDYIGEDQNFVAMLKGGTVGIPTSISLQELVEMQFFADMVSIPDEVLETLAAIRRELKDEGIRPSDRRFVQSTSLLRAKATLAGRQQVIMEDIMILRSSLWEKPDQRDKTVAIVKKYALDIVQNRLDEIRKEVSDILESVKQASANPSGPNTAASNAAVEGSAKLGKLMKELDSLHIKYPDRPEITQGKEAIRKIYEDITSAVLGV